MIYLASPYSHPDESVRLDRFDKACRVAAILMMMDKQVFSPIAHTHPIAMAAGGCLDLGWEFWEQFDRWYLERCDELIVLELDGWEQSKGVQAELKIMRELGKPVCGVTYEAIVDAIQKASDKQCE
jgi:nucleoside 2-deoxyribosyltransferase